MDDRPDVAADPSGRHRLAHSHPAGSFEPLHPADVVQIVRFLERRRISQVDPRHKPAARFGEELRHRQDGSTWANPTPTAHSTSSAFIPAISRRKSAMSVFVAIFDRSISTGILTAAVRASAWASVKPAAVRRLTVSWVSRGAYHRPLKGYPAGEPYPPSSLGMKKISQPSRIGWK